GYHRSVGHKITSWYASWYLAGERFLLSDVVEGCLVDVCVELFPETVVYSVTVSA
ncbi:hypothetical protein Tco_0396035, partial [Tanacetum coccineum]